MKLVLLVILAIVAVSGAALAYGHWRWTDATRSLHQRLDAARAPHTVTRVDLREVDDLPPPVRRYFRAALQDGAPIVAGATVVHRGTFNMSADPARPQWKTFDSHQRVVTRRPGFVWDGRVRMLPGLAVHVHDAYVAGEGLLHPAVAGLVSLTELRDSGDTAQGELMRFFAEAAWHPTALLPSQGVTWSALDDTSAEATLQDGPHRLTLTFFFGPDGLVQRVRAEARGRAVGSQIVPTPWEGRWSNVELRDGMRVPMTGEVAWLLPEGDLPYWRGTITDLQYEPAN